MSNSDGPFRTGPEPESAYPVYDHGARECAINLLYAHALVAPLWERTLRRFALGFGSFNMLMILRSAEAPLPPYVIGERIAVSRPAVTGILTDLESRDLISRTVHPSDRRMFLIEITEAGRGLIEAVLPHIFRLEHEVFSCLSPTEQEQLIALLGKVESRARSVDVPRPSRRGTRHPAAEA